MSTNEVILSFDYEPDRSSDIVEVMKKLAERIRARIEQGRALHELGSESIIVLGSPAFYRDDDLVH